MIELATSTPTVFALSQIFVILFVMIVLFLIIFLSVGSVFYVGLSALKPAIRIVRGKYTRYN